MPLRWEARCRGHSITWAPKALFLLRMKMGSDGRACIGGRPRQRGTCPLNHDYNTA